MKMEAAGNLPGRDSLIIKENLDEIEIISNKPLENYPLDEFFRNFGDRLVRITVLNLSNCGLNKDKLPNIVNLKSLDLSKNKFTRVPHCLYINCPAIKYLDLSGNDLKEFDIEPACCAALEILKLNDNKLYNLPQWIIAGVSSNLKEVIYSNNNIEDLSKTSSKLYLEKLEMRNSNLIDIDVFFFKKIATLKYLDISNSVYNHVDENRFKDIDELFMKPKFTAIEILKMMNLSISVIPKGLFSHTSIVELHLNHGCLTWIPAEVEYLKSLAILEISNNTLCYLPTELCSLEYLKIIKAAYNKIVSIPEKSLNVDVLDIYDNYLEELPEWIKEIELIDIEKNFVDTTPFEGYDIKKTKLRESVHESDRFDGVREPLSQERESESHSSPYNTDSEGTNTSSHPYVDMPSWEEENWDDEYNSENRRKNSMISSSDNEWQANDDFSRFVLQKVSKQPKQYVEDEDWIFCDAD